MWFMPFLQVREKKFDFVCESGKHVKQFTFAFLCLSQMLDKDTWIDTQKLVSVHYWKAY